MHGGSLWGSTGNNSRQTWEYDFAAVDWDQVATVTNALEGGAALFTNVFSALDPTNETVLVLPRTATIAPLAAPHAIVAVADLVP